MQSKTISFGTAFWVFKKPSKSGLPYDVNDMRCLKIPCMWSQCLLHPNPSLPQRLDFLQILILWIIDNARTVMC